MAKANALGVSLFDVEGSGAFVGSLGATLVTPNLGTPASGDLSNCTGASSVEVPFELLESSTNSTDDFIQIFQFPAGYEKFFLEVDFTLESPGGAVAMEVSTDGGSSWLGSTVWTSAIHTLTVNGLANSNATGGSEGRIVILSSTGNDPQSGHVSMMFMQTTGGVFTYMHQSVSTVTTDGICMQYGGGVVNTTTPVDGLWIFSGTVDFSLSSYQWYGLRSV